MKRYLAVFLAIAVLLVCQAVQAVDASSTWNQCNNPYHFGSYPQSSTTTFRQAYTGSNFDNDFAAIVNHINQTLSLRGGPIVGDDTLNATLENW